jgi:hypothetical protein
VKNTQLQRDVTITEKCVELKTVKMSQVEFRRGGWPPISTCIIEVGVVALAFCSSFEQIVKRLNLTVWAITLQHCFGGKIFENTSGI